MVVVASLLLADRLPRFYQGDSIAYMTTGLNGWVPFDRSWAYGYGSRWLVVVTHSTAALIAAQALLLLGAIVLLSSAFAGRRHAHGMALAFVLVATLDPLNEAYARFWLSDTPAAAFFLAWVALIPIVLREPKPRWLVLSLSLLVLASVFVRVAYAPVELGTLLICLVLALVRRRNGGRSWRRLVALCLLPVIAAGLLAAANSRVSISDLRGKLFLNRASDLYTMIVFLPALTYEDFIRGGVKLTHPEFDRLQLGLYDGREVQMWGEGPQFVRSLMQQKLHLDHVYDLRFERRCAAVMRSALLNHPQTLLLAYLRSLSLYFGPGEWQLHKRGEMGFERSLPDWPASFLSFVTGRTVRPDVTEAPSLLTGVLMPVIGLYPFLIGAGAVVSVLTLVGARRVGAAEVVAASMLSSLLVAPLFSHAVKPRYMLSTVTLSELAIVLALCDERVMGVGARLRRDGRSRPDDQRA